MRKSKKPVEITPIEVAGKVISIGNLVRYYLDGWRCGYLESVKGNVARIRPIGPKDAAQPRSVNVPVADVATP